MIIKLTESKKKIIDKKVTEAEYPLNEKSDLLIVDKRDDFEILRVEDIESSSQVKTMHKIKGITRVIRAHEQPEKEIAQKNLSN